MTDLKQILKSNCQRKMTVVDMVVVVNIPTSDIDGDGGVDDAIDNDGDGDINLDRCDVSGSAVDQPVPHHRLLQPQRLLLQYSL